MNIDTALREHRAARQDDSCAHFPGGLDLDVDGVGNLISTRIVMMAIDQPGNYDEPACIELPIRFLRCFATRSNNFCDIAPVDHNTVCSVGFSARPEGKRIFDPRSR